MRGDAHCRQSGVSAAVAAASAGPGPAEAAAFCARAGASLLASLAIDLLRRIGRRLLQERSAERIQRDGRSRRRDGIARRHAPPLRARPAHRMYRSRPQAGSRRVALVAGAEEPREASRAAEHERQQAAGEWIERAGVADRGSPSTRRTRATMSCEVGPTGLSTRSRPSMAVRVNCRT